MDKFGRHYADLVNLQKRQLAQLKNVLLPEVHAELAEWCLLINSEAEPPTGGAAYRAGGLHSCPVGVELYNWLMSYGHDDSIL